VWVASTTPSMRRVRAREYMELWGCEETQGRKSPIPSLYCCPVEDDAEEEDDEEDDAVGRFLRRCWLCGMPRCTAR
jgi:hypothetical protein